MKLRALDHLVLTVTDIERSIRFYQKILGMKPVHFCPGRVALRFGTQKINLHPLDTKIEPRAYRPTFGSADLCFLIEGELEDAIDELKRSGIVILAGPVERTGATGPLLSLYFRDPDGNLIELSTPLLDPGS